MAACQPRAWIILCWKRANHSVIFSTGRLVFRLREALALEPVCLFQPSRGEVVHRGITTGRLEGFTLFFLFSPLCYLLSS